MALDLTLKQLEDSKVFVSPIDVLTFKEPVAYLEPFLDKFSGMDIQWTFKGEIGSRNKNVEDELGEAQENVAYSAVSAIARLPQEFDFLVDDPRFNNLFSDLGFVYNLSGQKPLMRLFRGSKVSVCTNSCVFGAENVSTVYLTGGKSQLSDLYDKTSRYIDSALENVARTKRTIESMNSKVIKGTQELNELFGKMARLGINNRALGIQPMTQAMADMLDKKSVYAVEDNMITAWKAYNAITEQLKKSPIALEATKVLMLEELFVTEDTKVSVSFN